MAQTVDEALSAAQFYSDSETYVLVQLPANAITAAAGVIAEISEPFCVMIVDKDEVTLLIPAEALQDFSSRLREHRVSAEHYRLITIDVALEPTLTGFMAHISTALAQSGVPVFPYAAYTRDHIFIPAGQFETALAALEKLKSGK